MKQGAPLFGKMLREPLVHFAVLAGFLFFFLSDPDAETPGSENRITISSAEVERLAVAWTQRWQRPPTEDELTGMVRGAVREQVLYREALAIGLDRDDVVIRRHLRQKYEFVTQDLAYDTNPDDATLRAFHAADPDRYTQSARLSFSHFLFSPERRGQKAAADALQALTDLQLAIGPQAADLLGDPTSLPTNFVSISDREVEARFGPEFAATLLEQQPGRWVGPISSGYGLHLVWLAQKLSGGPLPFEAVRQRVKDDWIYDQRIVANEKVFQQILARYEIVVEPMVAAPEPAEGGS